MNPYNNERVKFGPARLIKHHDTDNANKCGIAQNVRHDDTENATYSQQGGVNYGDVLYLAQTALPLYSL